MVISKRGYSTREAAQFIGKSVAWLRKKRTRGPDDPGDPGPTWVATDGGSITYLREDLDVWLDGLARAPSKGPHERMLIARQAKQAKRLAAKSP